MFSKDPSVALSESPEPVLLRVRDHYSLLCFTGSYLSPTFPTNSSQIFCISALKLLPAKGFPRFARDFKPVSMDHPHASVALFL